MESPETPEANGTGRAFITVGLGGTVNARTVVPATPTFSKYELDFYTGGIPDGLDHTYQSTPLGSGVTVELLPGTYGLTVTVYQKLTFSGGTETEYLVGSGTASGIEITLGQNTVVPITINPGTDPDLKGIFSFTLTLPSGANDSTLVLQKAGDNPVTITGYITGTKYSIEVAPGSYDLFVTATAFDGRSAGYYTAVIVCTGLESWAELDLSGLTLTAPVTVSFNTAGGAPAPEPIGVAKGGAMGFLPAAPVKENYTFSGWYTGQNGSGTEFTASTPVTADCAVYAYWKQALGGTVTISGDAIVGQTLTATTGLTDQAGTLYYQWKAGADDVGTDSATYTVTAADMGRAISVTVTSSGNTGSVTSAATAAVVYPVLGGTITISGTAFVGQTLTTIMTALTGQAGTLSYQWKAGADDVGTDSATYTITAADLGKTITVTITSSESTGSVTSAATATVSNLSKTGVTFGGGPQAEDLGNLGNPSASIIWRQGESLTATVNTTAGTWADGADFAWYLDGVILNSETNAAITINAMNYLPGTHTLAVKVTKNGESYSKTAVFTMRPVMGGTVTLSGTAVPGNTLTAVTTGLTGLHGKLHYQWKAGGSPVGTDSVGYTIGKTDFGKTITVTVTSSGTDGSVESGATEAVVPGAAAAVGTEYQSLAAYLSGLPATTAASPATVVLSPVTIDTEDATVNGVWATVNSVVQAAGKYVILDLSACSAARNTISGDYSTTPSGNKMNIIRNHSYIKGVILPSSLTGIGSDAFSYCSNLTSVSIPATVTSIAPYAFYYCFQLTSVSIPATVTNIGSDAFSRCSSLTSVTFEAGSLISVGFGSDAFPQGSLGAGGDNLKTAYAAGGAGTYTRVVGDFIWTKQ
jgi:uncharacterized repeat protein (TIGR02543 family)